MFSIIKILTSLLICCTLFCRSSYYHHVSSRRETTVDRKSFIVENFAKEWVDFGIARQESGNLLESIEFYTLSLVSVALSPVASRKLAEVHGMLGHDDMAQHWNERCLHDFDLAIDSVKDDVSQATKLIRITMDKGIFLFNMKMYYDAIETFDGTFKQFEVHEQSIQILYRKDFILYEIGNCYQKLGNILKAFEYYVQSVVMNRHNYRTHLSLGALFHENGQLSEAMYHYDIILRNINMTTIANTSVQIASDSYHNEYIMVLSNMLLAMYESGNLLASRDMSLRLLEYLSSLQETACGPANTSSTIAEYFSCENLNHYLGFGYSNLVLVLRKLVLFHRWEEIHSRAVELTLKSINGGNGETYVLPFDSLLYDITLQDRLDIAFAYSTARIKQVKAVRRKMRTTATMRLGFLSFDFNDHPTSQLLEGFFAVVQNYSASCSSTPNLFCDVQLYAYNYGKNDNSSYRRRLVELADHFFDTAEKSFEEIEGMIRSHDIDILFDMQVHTKSNRLDILFSRPAPIIVNYLVYPGTAGSTLHDYIVVDNVVVPPENAHYYTESLLLLPPTYQVSTRDQHAVPKNINSIFRPEEVVLCNFNKIDKLDPSTFHSWMNILQSNPRSIIWLLQPSTPRGSNDAYNSTEHNLAVGENIRAVAALWGIHPKRIVFAERVKKAEHVARQHHAHLFLDSFIYGAHSTATDALRGGLPVLTIESDSFPSRVAASLLATVSKADDDLDMLVRHSVKDYEETALALSRSTRVIEQLKEKLTSANEREIGLFDTNSHVNVFMRSLLAVKEANILASSRDSIGGTDKPFSIVTLS